MIALRSAGIEIDSGSTRDRAVVPADWRSQRFAEQGTTEQREQ
jgi:hypothetical protein